MKVKTISRSEEAFTRERTQDVDKVHRNLDPTLHPMERAVEYTRAVNTAKLDRVFAKPFIAALSGHCDGVTAMAKNPKRLSCILSGAADGEVRLWDVPGQRPLRRLMGHTASVTGIACSQDGEVAVSCSSDMTARLWRLSTAAFETSGAGSLEDESSLVTFNGKNGFRGIDHHRQASMFATCGAVVEVWDHDRSEPVHTFSWGSETVTSVRFNPAEPDLFATTGSDRSICLYDLRRSTPLRKVVMQTRVNAVCWNPMEPFNFAAASEDCNVYSWDMRKLDMATCIHKDHVSAVMDVDFSPTGREFVTGSYDRSVRIFAYNGGHSREIYHTKRMQRVMSVRFSGDGTYVLSGSDDMNIRIWKANASQQLGTLLPREKHKQAYQAAIKDRYKHLPEVKRIDRHRHLPKAIYKADKLRTKMQEGERVKHKRRLAHSAPGKVPNTPARKKKIVTQIE